MKRIRARGAEGPTRACRTHTRAFCCLNTDRYMPTGLSSTQAAGNVYVKRGKCNAYKIPANAGRTMYTVLFCGLANGVYMPPFVIYKCKQLRDLWCQGGPKDTMFGRSDSGWMQDFNFKQWFMKGFIPFVKSYPKLVVLTFNGHGSHLTYLLVKAALENDIILVCLPPNTSHALQPLDVGVFNPVKTA